MWSILVFLFACSAGVLCRPSSNVTDNEVDLDRPLSEEDYGMLDNLGTDRLTYPPGFKFLYVSQQGQIIEDLRPAAGHYIQVVGSPGTTHAALNQAAQNVFKMLKHSSATLFNAMSAKGATVGIFTKEETIVVFPQLARLRDTAECRGTCNGTCKRTCTFDQRKWYTVAGLTSGTYSVTMQENLLCQNDPHYGRHSTLVHETGHLVMNNGMTANQKTDVKEAYSHALSAAIWNNNEYAMTNYREYWAEATATFFNVELESNNAGMNNCVHGACALEDLVRKNIQQKDGQLYDILVDVYVPDDPFAASGLTICPSHDLIG